MSQKLPHRDIFIGKIGYKFLHGIVITKQPSFPQHHNRNSSELLRYGGDLEDRMDTQRCFGAKIGITERLFVNSVAVDADEDGAVKASGMRQTGEERIESGGNDNGT